VGAITIKGEQDLRDIEDFKIKGEQDIRMFRMFKSGIRSRAFILDILGILFGFGVKIKFKGDLDLHDLHDLQDLEDFL